MSKVNVMKLFFGFLLLGFLAVPAVSFADWSVGVNVGGPGYHDHDYYRWHDHPHWGMHAHFLPAGYSAIWVGGAQYYYYDGLYYTNVGNGDYVLVQPPMGAEVGIIPPDFQPVLINGGTYYTNNGIYYRLTPHGYRIVNPPVVYAQPAPVIVEQAPQVVVSQGTFPVNVPNNSGGYTSVLIRRSGSGYVGPQGEYYPGFPTVNQLKAMYGK